MQAMLPKEFPFFSEKFNYSWGSILLSVYNVGCVCVLAGTEVWELPQLPPGSPVAGAVMSQRQIRPSVLLVRTFIGSYTAIVYQ